MRVIHRSITVVVSLLVALAATAQTLERELHPPRIGIFYSMYQGTNATPHIMFPPPFDPAQVPVYVLDRDNKIFLMDDRSVGDVYYSNLLGSGLQPGTPTLPSGSDPEGNGPDPATSRNYAKFMPQFFSLLDTNVVAATDTNLYDVIISFPDDTNTFPTLQIARAGYNAVVIKANHFDYSGEDRSFALLVSDAPDRPLWKTIDFQGISDSQDGWIMQGSVAPWKVTDPMYLLVSNLTSCAFFRAIPYGGPLVQLTGAQDYDVVSNTITLQAQITDLAGVTNDTFQLDVNGGTAQHSLQSTNTVSLDTRYNLSTIQNINFFAASHPLAYDTNNPPDNVPVSFQSSASLALIFQNDTFLAFASDMCSTDVSTNHIQLNIATAQHVTTTIAHPNGAVVATYSDTYPAGTVDIPWNFSESDGVTPYTNEDTYVVRFTPEDTSPLQLTNTIDRIGVRIGAGCFLTYEYENPAFIPGFIVNQNADTWIYQTLKSLYRNLYDPQSLTQYLPSVVGTNRNHSDCQALTISSYPWGAFMWAITNKQLYSDLTIAGAHGSGASIGGGDYLSSKFSPMDLAGWVLGFQSSDPNWRLRKASLWACYSGDVSEGATAGRYSSFASACGIRPTGMQENSLMRKNVGLFFGKEIPIYGYAGGACTGQVAAFADQAWVCGKFQFPGGCDPTYTFRFSVRATIGEYPLITVGEVRVFGYASLCYSSIYDDELMMLNTAHVKDN